MLKKTKKQKNLFVLKGFSPLPYFFKEMPPQFLRAKEKIFSLPPGFWQKQP